MTVSAVIQGTRRGEMMSSLLVKNIPEMQGGQGGTHWTVYPKRTDLSTWMVPSTGIANFMNKWNERMDG
jgi:hypothetical protein